MTSGNTFEFSLKEKRTILSEAMGFEGMVLEDLEPLASVAFGQAFGRGDFIFTEGEPAGIFHVVARGRVKLNKLSSSGKSITAVLATPGSTLNAAVLFDRRQRFLTAQAMDDVVVLCIPGADFVRFVETHSQVAVNIIRILCRILDSSYERLMDMVAERVEQRLLNVLYMLYNKFGPDLAFTGAELSELAGTTTETTLRIISQLKEMDIVHARRGQIVIKDPQKLRSIGRWPLLI